MNAISYKTVIFLYLLRLLACLPLQWLYVLSDLISLLLQYVIRYRKIIIYGNLHRSFPEKSDKEISRIITGFYHHLADCIVESIKLLHISDKQLKRHITVVGGDFIEKLASDGRSIIVFLGHYGNWEWVQEVTHRYIKPGVNAEIYRPVKNKVMDNIMITIRSRFSTLLIPQKKAVRQLLQMHHEGIQFLVGFIADQRPNSDNLHHWTTFLNQDTAYAVGGEEIGNHIQAHFVYLDIEKTRRGHYSMTFKPIAINNNSEYPYTIEFIKMMERTIRRQPEYWLWSHNRWKYNREGNKIYMD